MSDISVRTRRVNQISTPRTDLIAPAHFRLKQQFEVAVDLARIDEFSPQQKRLIYSIFSSAQTMQKMTSLAIESELKNCSGYRLEHMLQSVDDRAETVLDYAAASLPEEDRVYWEELKSCTGDELSDAIMPVFFAFRVNLLGFSLVGPGGSTLRKWELPRLIAE
ncbi:hypothetical protein [Edaphobacter dinghuensis]|uniref:Uncharacterized protein n=1 Tax=Edaphobacter dinghuensis TaxID=1560005 RepID=A0A917HR65_9BACT|nr:hypothetical protein [Edaphobacter dinghuensis]GGG86768.1 hypothetical protein GCM10011585_33410 [Edaphobacter dinghuensis]